MALPFDREYLDLLWAGGDLSSEPPLGVPAEELMSVPPPPPSGALLESYDAPEWRDVSHPGIEARAWEEDFYGRLASPGGEEAHEAGHGMFVEPLLNIAASAPGLMERSFGRRGGGELPPLTPDEERAALDAALMGVAGPVGRAGGKAWRWLTQTPGLMRPVPGGWRTAAGGPVHGPAPVAPGARSRADKLYDMAADPRTPAHEAASARSMYERLTGEPGPVRPVEAPPAAYETLAAEPAAAAAPKSARVGMREAYAKARPEVVAAPAKPEPGAGAQPHVLLQNLRGDTVKMPAVYLRAGGLPVDAKGNVTASKNWNTDEPEDGISVFTAWKDPRTGKFVVESGSEGLIADMDLLLDDGGGRPIYLVEGTSLSSVGNAGESLIDPSTARVVGHVGPDEIVNEQDPWLTMTGAELPRSETPSWKNYEPSTEGGFAKEVAPPPGGPAPREKDISAMSDDEIRRLFLPPEPVVQKRLPVSVVQKIRDGADDTIPDHVLLRYGEEIQGEIARGVASASSRRQLPEFLSMVEAKERVDARIAALAPAPATGRPAIKEAYAKARPEALPRPGVLAQDRLARARSQEGSLDDVLARQRVVGGQLDDAYKSGRFDEAADLEMEYAHLNSRIESEIAMREAEGGVERTEDWPGGGIRWTEDGASSPTIRRSFDRLPGSELERVGGEPSIEEDLALLWEDTQLGGRIEEDFGSTFDSIIFGAGGDPGKIPPEAKRELAREIYESRRSHVERLRSGPQGPMSTVEGVSEWLSRPSPAPAPAPGRPALRAAYEAGKPEPVAPEPVAPEPLASATPAPLRPVKPVEQTRWFHGTKADISDIGDFDPYYHGNPENLFGYGLYLTDEPAIATGYAKTRGPKASPGQIMEVQVDALNTLDLDRPLPPDVVGHFGTTLYGETYTPDPNATGREVVQGLRDFMGDHEFPTSEASEVLGDLAEVLKDKGYAGMRHIGGRTGRGVSKGKPEHNVLILFDPNDIYVPSLHGQPVRQPRVEARSVRSEPVAPEPPPPTQTPAQTGGPHVGPRGGKWVDPQHKTPWMESMSAESVRAHVSAVDKGGKHGHPATVGRVKDVPHIKTTLSLDDLDVIEPGDTRRVAEYAARETPMPAIQGGYNARSYGRGKATVYVPNGNHRVAAAKLRGDTHIEVIMPTADFELWSSRTSPPPPTQTPAKD